MTLITEMPPNTYGSFRVRTNRPLVDFSQASLVVAKSNLAFLALVADALGRQR
jgi:hypothetical protein